MTNTRAWSPLVLALFAAAFIGCGGGGGGGGGDGAAVIPPPGGNPDEGTPPGEYVVVRYDQDGDGNADLLTLDKTETPFTVVEALAGTADGGSVDATAALSGQPIDPAISDGLAAYLADSMELASETDLDVISSTGTEITVTIFE